MKRLVSLLFILLVPAVPAESFAKAETSKIIITGAVLNAPINITDPKTLANFGVWTGAGTNCTGNCPQPNPESFIVNWSQPVADHPRGLHRYQVSFYAKMPEERLIYVVFYEYDPASEHGYVYFPGRTEEWYRLNVSTIFHGVEGKWFRASSTWEVLARPLISPPTDSNADQSQIQWTTVDIPAINSLCPKDRLAYTRLDGERRCLLLPREWHRGRIIPTNPVTFLRNSPALVGITTAKLLDENTPEGLAGAYSLA